MVPSPDREHNRALSEGTWEEREHISLHWSLEPCYFIAMDTQSDHNSARTVGAGQHGPAVLIPNSFITLLMLQLIHRFTYTCNITSSGVWSTDFQHHSLESSSESDHLKQNRTDYSLCNDSQDDAGHCERGAALPPKQTPIDVHK